MIFTEVISHVTFKFSPLIFMSEFFIFFEFSLEDTSRQT